ncbi:MAG: ribosomal-protein-alanine N-acetyltransferase [Thermoprotei archaeon]|nr:MAG: ribosomal-protein-alanine N-acetyltransferase [Thermoprotei archaeon]
MRKTEENVIIIRKASPSDFAQIVKIENLSFEKPYPPALILSLLYLHSDLFYVAVANNEVIGYVVGAKKGNGHGHVISIAVKPEWRRRGVGTKLMEALLNAFKERGLKAAILEVATSNREAIAFYKALGFEKIDLMKKYYPWGEDAYVMIKKL